jgi:predicted RND superfamily exporter protein
MRNIKLIKSLTVSICAVVLLVLGSLTNVVGYQSVKSTVVNESPLFNIRTRKANNQQQNILTSQYLGKGERNLLRFPMRDNQTEILNKVIESIKKMDDKTFERFTKLCIQKIRQDNTFSDTDPHEIKQILHMLRTQSDRNNLYQLKNNFNTTSPTIWEHSICNWNPGCVIVNIFGIIYVIIVAIIFFIIIMLSFVFPTLGCQPTYIPNSIPYSVGYYMKI